VRRAGVVALALFALLAGVSRAGSGPTLVAQGSVESISAERGLVAVHVHHATGCDGAVIWAPSASAVHTLRDCSSSNARIQGLTLAAGKTIWWDWSSGNHVYCDDVYRDGHALGLCDGTEGDTYYQFAGDGTLVAIADYTVCEADCTDANGNVLPDGDYGVEVSRLVGSKAVPLLKPVDFRVFLDARSWRVATIEPKATLTMYDTAGTKLWSRPGATGVFGGWISGDTVVLQQTRSIRAYSATGAGVARPLPPGARVGGVVGGLVAYRAGSSVRVLRLSDGRDRLLATAGRLVGVQITPAGVFYATRTVVTLVPIGDVLLRLR
jgi:hypothetical protein